MNALLRCRYFLPNCWSAYRAAAQPEVEPSLYVHGLDEKLLLFQRQLVDLSQHEVKPVTCVTNADSGKVGIVDSCLHPHVGWK